MAVSSLFQGNLIGYDMYTSKDGKENHTYYVLIAQKPDPETKLYKECDFARVKEEAAVLIEPKYGMKVSFYGELCQGAKGQSSYYRYSGIEAVK